MPEDSARRRLLPGGLLSCLMFLFPGTWAHAVVPAQGFGNLEIHAAGGTLTVYPPEVEALEGRTLTARAAVAILRERETEPRFAAIRFTGRVAETTAPTIEATGISLVDVQFDDASATEAYRLQEWIAKLLTGAAIQVEVPDPETIPTPAADAPVILLSRVPAILVPIDGQPIFEPIPSTKLERVLNSPFTILRDIDYYLRLDDANWFTAETLLGPWQRLEAIPVDLGALPLGPAPGATATDSSAGEEARTIPSETRIIVVTDPTELIVTTGAPSWSPVIGMDLLYLNNSTSDVFLHIPSGRNYVLVSGRWYRGILGDPDTPWEHVANDDLPPAFARLERDDFKSHVRTHIAGTDESEAAVLRNSVPRVRRLDRGLASHEIEWHGTPAFDPVHGLDDLEYGINTGDPVFRVGGRYYLCHDGAWYRADSAFGPFWLADRIPTVIYDIPRTHRHHHTTYVRVFESTPTYVLVGYTGGYFGSYDYHGSLVYGYGHHEPDWRAGLYQPRPLTFGLDVYYDPFFGWVSGAHRPNNFRFRHLDHVWFTPGIHRLKPKRRHRLRDWHEREHQRNPTLADDSVPSRNDRPRHEDRPPLDAQEHPARPERQRRDRAIRYERAPERAAERMADLRALQNLDRMGPERGPRRPAATPGGAREPAPNSTREALREALRGEPATDRSRAAIIVPRGSSGPGEPSLRDRYRVGGSVPSPEIPKVNPRRNVAPRATVQRTYTPSRKEAIPPRVSDYGPRLVRKRSAAKPESRVAPAPRYRTTPPRQAPATPRSTSPRPPAVAPRHPPQAATRVPQPPKASSPKPVRDSRARRVQQQPPTRPKVPPIGISDGSRLGGPGRHNR